MPHLPEIGFSFFLLAGDPVAVHQCQSPGSNSLYQLCYVQLAAKDILERVVVGV